MAGMLAISNVGRAAAFRSGYFLRDTVVVRIGSAVRTGVIQQSIRIDLNTGVEPHRATFEFRGGGGYVPLAGQTVTIGHGSVANALFAGRLTRVTRRAIRNADTKPTYACEASGWMFDINQSRVAPGFSVQSIAPFSLVRRLLVSTSPNVSSLGFTATGIETTLPLVSEFSVGPAEEITNALARLFRSVDAVWYMDHAGDLHAFTTVNSTTAIPATITSAASQVWNVRYAPTDFSRIFTRAHVLGAIQPTIADYEPTRHVTVPLASASLLGNAQGSFGDDSFINTTESWLFDGVQFNAGFFFTPGSQFNAGKASVFLPASRSTNTLVVVSANVTSLSPIDPDRWYDIAGQMVYVSSTVGVYSATASSIAYAYYVPSNGSGMLTADIESFADIAAPWQITINSPSLFYSRMVPAGAPLQVISTKVNSAGVDYVGSLTGGEPSFGLISRTVEDQRLSPDGAAAVASTLLQRGAPANWVSLEFSTRAEDYVIGGPVFVSMTSPTESGGASIEGIYTVQDMTIEGFGELTGTKGPVRSVVSGAVRRPTMWQVLQGDR